MPKNDRYQVEESGGLPKNIAEQVFVQPNVVKPRGPERAQLQAENEELKGQLEQLQAMINQRPNSSALAVQDGAIVIEDFQLTTTSLIAPEHVTPEAWEHIGRVLLRLEGSIQWLVGDWLVYGMDLDYGDIKAFADYFERDEHTLYNYMSVSRKVQSSLRNEHLSYNHHVAVSKLKPTQQERALAYAIEAGPSVAVFRKWIQDEFGERSTPALPSSDAHAPDLKPLSTEFKKLMQRDPVRAEEYLDQVEQWASKMREQLLKRRT